MSRCASLMITVEGTPWPQTGPTHYHVQLRLPDKRRAIERVGCLLCSVVRIYEGDGSIDQRKVRRSGPLLWSERLSSSSTATPHIKT